MTKIVIEPSNTSIIPDYYKDELGLYCLDIKDTSKIAITLQDDWTVGGEPNKSAINRSYPMTIPATDKNNLFLEHLADANFDPEFYKLHEKEIIAKFNQENNTNIQLKKKSWKRIFSA